MKKMGTLILSVIMVMALNITTFAGTIGTGNQSIDVQGKYQSSITTPTVYSVDVAWGAMQFTYNESGTMTWNPANHIYSDTTSGGWTVNGNTVTVVNHSNADVTADFSFSALNDYSTITGKFDIASKTLNAGVEGDYANADKVNTTLVLYGTIPKAVTDYTKIGTITITIK